MQLLEYFHELSIHPKNAKELKGLILQLAVQGKLTKKWRGLNPGVEPASELLKRIQKEKEQLVKEKKIKKEKPLSSITKKEIPYKLPENWVWCRLIEVCEYIQRGKSPKYTEVPKIPVISQKCVQWSGFDIARARFITEESLVKYGEERFLQVGDLLWNSTGDGTIGRVISFTKTDYEKVVADSHVTVVRSFKDFVLPDYLWIFTASPLIQDLVAGRVSGSTKQTELGTGTVKSLEFSFPPFEEQKVIVEIVEQLFKEIEQLEQLTEKRIQLKEDFATSALQQLQEKNTKDEWAYLQKHFNTFFTEESNIKKLRETILQLAVQGKLTKDWRTHNPTIEPASKLLERIKAEKQQLIAAKKIKKEKVLPPIAKVEIPYELPEGWVWCRLGSLVTVKGGKRLPKGETLTKIDTGKIYVRVTDMKGGTISKNDLHYLTLNAFEKIKNYTISKDDVYLTIVGATIGKLGLVPDFFDGMNLTENAVKIINYGVSKHLMKLFLESIFIQDQFLNKTKQVGVPKLAMHRVNSTLFPTPPVEEQKIVVEKVNNLMTLCDQLEEQVKAGKQQSEKLMKSVLREVFNPKAKEEGVLSDLLPNLDKYMQVAMITQKMENAFGFNHGKVEKQKTSFLLKAIKKQSIPYNFEKSNYGTFSWELSEDLDSNPFLQKSSIDKGSVYQIKLNKQSEVLTALNDQLNSSFVQAVDELIQVYQNPLISGKTDKIELLNTVCKLILDLKTNDLDIVYKAMQDWQIKQNGCNTKADKFSKKDTEKMLRLVIKLGWDIDILK